MTQGIDARAAAEAARAMIAALGAQAPDGAPAPPIPVFAPRDVADGLSPGAAPRSWFVPLVGGERITGFCEISATGEPLRVSAFQRRRGDLSGCPPAADWLDPARVLERARAAARPDEAAGSPALSFDGDPSRIAWAVAMTGPDGRRRVIHVAGASAWEARPGPARSLDGG